VLDPAWDDEELASAELHRFAALELDAERAVPAQEELVLVVVVPGELTLETSDADHGVVGDDEIARLPGPGERADDLLDGDHGRFALVHERRG
jgi:hypothetical protein